ncbi:hypothetical protein [Caminicella sporogenes]|uniref:hypothetical protein n=1 Tax=Caminicella sporogenes TaxID=166485 RepID=UPI00254247C9|nr:hypothetical protein [Caminicella sporogenes]WIF95143.1 hypothetical protein QNI18_00445 [Caminicella sporogenes]
MNKNFEVNKMRAFEVNDYWTIIAKNKDEAIKFYIEECEGDETEIFAKEINPEKHYMYFPIEEIPETRLKELKQENAKTYEYEGKIYIQITKAEAMKYRKEEKPYILSVSAELL